jgi:hypothetical protein
MEQFACCTLILCPQNLEEGNNSGIDVSTVEGLQCHIYISHISKTKTACCDVLCPQKSEEGNDSGTDVSTVEGLQCHALWLNFFDEMWDSVGDGAAATTQQASMREVGACI